MPDDVNAELVRAGSGRIVQPKVFGEYEFDVPALDKVMMEISRGCSETAWVLALTAGHPLIAAFFPEEGQNELYSSNGEFCCPAGSGSAWCRLAKAVEGGYRVTAGQWVSASGIDHATHFVTMAHGDRSRHNPTPPFC